MKMVRHKGKKQYLNQHLSGLPVFSSRSLPDTHSFGIKEEIRVQNRIFIIELKKAVNKPVVVLIIQKSFSLVHPPVKDMINMIFNELKFPHQLQYSTKLLEPDSDSLGNKKPIIS